jgi:hypothetical protein
VLLPQQLQLGHLAVIDQLADLLGRALADALDLLQLLGGQRPRVGGQAADGAGRALVSAHAKRLRVALLQHGQLGQLAQHLQNVLLPVSHGLGVFWFSLDWPSKEEARRRRCELAFR